MKLHCTISDGSEFDIQLIEHPFVHEWAQSVVNFKLLSTERTGLIGIGRKDPELFIARLNYLYGLVDAVIGLGLEVPIELIEPLPKYNDGGAVIQQWANNIHRWCSYSQRYISHPSIDNSGIIEFLQNNEYTNRGGLHRGPGEPDGLFNKINGAVHKLEVTYEQPGQQSMQGNDNQYWDQDFDLHYLENSPVTQGNTLAQYIRYGNFIDEIKDLLTNDYYTVWIAKRILGKDWRECYMNQDDPRSIDIENFPTFLQYAFEIDLNDWRQFYYGENFLNWLAKYNIEYDVTEMGRVPLGNVLIEHDELQQKINNNETITTLQIR